MKTTIKLFGGVEGGGTKTILTVVDENGRIMGVTYGGPTNPWTLSISAENGDGFLVAARRINDMVVECMQKIKSSEDATTTEYQLVAVALCLSGGGTQTAKVRLNEAFAKIGIDYQTIIANDTLSALFTAFKNGGIVVISGTGSNCILLNPVSESNGGCGIKSLDELNLSNAGGWGNILGDEGSAYWIAQKCIKYVIDHNDNFLLHNADDHHPSSASSTSDDENMTPTEVPLTSPLLSASPQLSQQQIAHFQHVEDMQTLIFQHFQVSSLGELLPHFYSDFRKDFIAGLTVKLAQIADKNEIVRDIFEEAGYQIARHIVALHPKISQSLIDLPGGLPIVCVGSVFKSWHLIKPGFMRCMYAHHHKRCSRFRELNLVTIADNSTIGAAILASKMCGYDLADYFVGESRLCNKLLTTPLDHIVLGNAGVQLTKPQYFHHLHQHNGNHQHHHHHPHHHQMKVISENDEQKAALHQQQ